MHSLHALAAGAMASFMLTGAAGAEQRSRLDLPDRYIVSYADLDLRSSEGRARLHWRVTSAVRAMCPGDDFASPAPPRPEPECFKRTMASARQQMTRAIAQANGGAVMVAVGTPVNH